ncbi:chromosome partitioning protein [Tabrizicola piscis]|uniref:Chromosome partitioning protein n=1 Tax=Tabrizicola piscis TaxID=2494374 RepID=A0A3S8UA64_9RHOB|nr:CpsD/CapB family tyrosine-protein kinase [Tabrizicola piscis]AZL60486.1 chromosome partitioning protein [Tabrizicola piscis]
MDRLHTAIAKARASRDGAGAPRAPGAARVPKASGPGAAWSTLPELRVSADVLDEHLLVAHRPGPDATAFDLMRTNLLRQLNEHGWTRVAITSPGAGCGKTTVALNLAFSLARLSDIRVLVLEMDLRRPTMVRALGMDRKPNFSAALAGTDTPEAHLIRWGENLAFGVTSTPVQSPSELLSSDRAADVVDAIEAAYRPTVILFDMPPMMAGDDTLAFLDQVDCALLIAAADDTPINQIEQCGKDLAAYAPVLGVVLNKCRLVDTNDAYYG